MDCRNFHRHQEKTDRKKKTAPRRRGRETPEGSQFGSSDDDSYADTNSVISLDSQYPTSPCDEDANSGIDESYSFEDRLKYYVDRLSESKSSPKRSQYLDMLSLMLADRYCPDFVVRRPATLIDMIERGLRKGKDLEQAAAANLAAVLAIQYGVSAEGTEVHRSLCRTFIVTMLNNSILPAVRERIANALAITAYLAEDDSYKRFEIMEHLRGVYLGSCAKGDGSMPSVSRDVSSLHQTALLSWGLLLTITQNHGFQEIEGNLSAITSLLHSSDVDMRVAAGEVLATIFEIARERDEDFLSDDFGKLCDDLHTLATDSQKFRAKKERKMQRASFRDIERAVRDGDGPDFKVQFGLERLNVRTWEDKRTYDAVCSLLGSGMNHHLQFNPEIRTLFDLGAPLEVSDDPADKVSRFERRMTNMIAEKRRTKHLLRARDKRLDVM